MRIFKTRPLTFLPVLLLAGIFAGLPVFAAPGNPGEALAKFVLQKAAVTATVCEMPRAGDGALAAALAVQGVAQVHALAPDTPACDRARQPAALAGVVGSQVFIETGSPAALPLGDWVADLYLVADASDATLKTLSAAEARRVLSPYRGVALLGNPAGVKSGLSKAALTAWAAGTGGVLTLSDDANGLWALVTMPPLKGGDDWGHFYHAPDANPVSQDTAFRGAGYQLQAFDYPIRGARNYTIEVSAGRLFVTYSPMDSNNPLQLVASNLYNARVLWRRPLPANFGENGSLMIATPERLYLKDGAGVLVLNPETGAQLTRIEVTTAPRNVMWLALAEGLLLTVSGPNPDATQEFVAYDAQTGKESWRFPAARIALRKLAVSSGRVFLYVNNSDIVALDLHSGKQLWRTPLPPTTHQRLAFDVSDNQGLPQALATKISYVLTDYSQRQCLMLDATDGHEIWKMPEAQMTNQWCMPAGPMMHGDTLVGLGISQLTGKRGPGGRSFASASCGHSTAVDAGLWIGYGVTDVNSGKQLSPNMAKAPCATGYFVADGTEVLFPNTCMCRGWHGLMLITPSTPLQTPVAPRLETGTAPPPARFTATGDDWPTYRADETRKGSSSAVLPANSALRWTYTPPRPAEGTGAVKLPANLTPDDCATQGIAVDDRLWVGRADGAVVCLDRQTGALRWTYWTAGRINATPLWWEGRVYAGSADGWLYCLDAATGQLCWRYRVAPLERRISVMGRLSSTWPVQSLLLHDGVVYATAGVMGQLDGSAMCALDARTGAEHWTKTFKNSGETYGNGKLKNETPTAWSGQMAWYGGKIWWQGVEFGPAVIDPATGAMTGAVDASYLGDNDSTYYDLSGTWNLLRGKDIGILPGGWVAIGNELMHGSCGQTDNLFLRSGPDGVPAGAENAPSMLSVNLQREFYINREIPVWDADEVLTRGNPAVNDGLPTLYHGFAEALNKEADAHLMKAPAPHRKLAPSTDELVKAVTLTLPAEQQHAALPDALWSEISHRQLGLYGSMLLASNAVVFTVHGQNGAVGDMMTGPMPNYGNWRVIAVNRADRTVLFDVRLPDAPAPSGLSLTRAGDVIIPLVDGRVVCVGAGAPPPATSAPGK